MFSEKNFGQAVAAAKRDLGDVTGQSNFRKTIFGLFVKGRQIITKGGNDVLEKIKPVARFT